MNDFNKGCIWFDRGCIDLILVRVTLNKDIHIKMGSPPNPATSTIFEVPEAIRRELLGHLGDGHLQTVFFQYKIR